MFLHCVSLFFTLFLSVSLLSSLTPSRTAIKASKLMMRAWYHFNCLAPLGEHILKRDRIFSIVIILYNTHLNHIVLATYESRRFCCSCNKVNEADRRIHCRLSLTHSLCLSLYLCLSLAKRWQIAWNNINFASQGSKTVWGLGDPQLHSSIAAEQAASFMSVCGK